MSVTKDTWTNYRRSTMARNLREVLAEFSPEDRRDIEAQAAKLIAEEYARRERQAKKAQPKAANGPGRSSNDLPQAAANG